MPFPMRIQPIDAVVAPKPIVKSRLKRLFDRPLLRLSSAADKSAGGGGGAAAGEAAEFEPSSVCLDSMVQNFIEESNEKTPVMTSAAKCGRNRCNCFHVSSNVNSDDEFGLDSNLMDSSYILKSLIPCRSSLETKLLEEAIKVVEENKGCKRKDDLRRIVTEYLLSLNYDAAICKSKWDKSYTISAGEYEYVDVIIEGERILIDVDFRSEFEIARSTASYKAVLQSLPFIFVGKTDRLSQIVSIVSEAARLSLKKKGMHIAPWRKAEYIKSKWLSRFTRIIPPNNVVNVIETPNNVVNVIETPNEVVNVLETPNKSISENNECMKEENVGIVSRIDIDGSGDCGIVDEARGLNLVPGEKKSSFEVVNSSIVSSGDDKEEKLDFTVKVPWEPPLVKEKSNRAIVTGLLASLLKEKP